jgi:hypothetical protein
MLSGTRSKSWTHQTYTWVVAVADVADNTAVLYVTKTQISVQIYIFIVSWT